MEAIVFLVLFWGGIALLGWVFDSIGKWNEARKAEERDKVAFEVLGDRDIKSEIAHYKNRLGQLGYDENEETRNFINYYRRQQTFGELLEECPDCHKGHLRVVVGKFGKFLGCANYPNCKYTTSIKAAKERYKENARNDFMSVFRSVYQ